MSQSDFANLEKVYLFEKGIRYPFQRAKLKAKQWLYSYLNNALTTLTSPQKTWDGLRPILLPDEWENDVGRRISCGNKEDDDGYEQATSRLETASTSISVIVAYSINNLITHSLALSIG
jgi:hypothetical protein